jgi:protein-L-isoaspartate(D-aspartate) O-methyltransferase
MTDPGEPLRQLLDELAAGGWLAPEWRPSFEAVPRHRFIPDTVWVYRGRAELVALHRSAEPDRWLELTQTNRPVITQVDDGNPDPDPQRRTATSSASMPLMVATMLDQLRIEGAERVLEIGTGTGYNAALLAHRLGADRITTIEIDADLAAHAGAALADAGFGEVLVVTADGVHAYPSRAPYDRVIATASCERIPYPWVQQTVPGGRVLIPWANTYFDGGLLDLTVLDDGTATGHIVGRSSFMWLRDQRVPRDPARDIVDPAEQQTTPTTWTDVHPWRVVGSQGAQLAISLQVPRCRQYYQGYDPDEGQACVWFLDPWSRSWASLTHTTPDASEDKFPVQQGGPRRLWDEVESACRWWVSHGRPAVDRWRFTVTPQGQRIELGL